MSIGFSKTYIELLNQEHIPITQPKTFTSNQNQNHCIIEINKIALFYYSHRWKIPSAFPSIRSMWSLYSYCCVWPCPSYMDVLFPGFLQKRRQLSYWVDCEFSQISANLINRNILTWTKIYWQRICLLRLTGSIFIRTSLICFAFVLF